MSALKELKETLAQYKPHKEAFSPFKLTFRMMTPICLTHPWVHLDGILAHILLRKLLKEQFYSLPSSMPIDFFELFELPLKTLRQGDLFIYHSSVSLFDGERFYIDKIYKRFEDRKMRFMDPGRSTKIDVSRGRFKNYMISLPYLPSSEITFFGHGDIEEIRNLIPFLPGLGKKIAAGFGFFHSFSIDQISKDKSLVNEKGEAMRPIPCEFLEGKGYERLLLACKFPYWAKHNVALCCNVKEKIELK